jgi:hypothetical protein
MASAYKIKGKSGILGMVFAVSAGGGNRWRGRMNILSDCFFNPTSPPVQGDLYALALVGLLRRDWGVVRVGGLVD